MAANPFRTVFPVPGKEGPLRLPPGSVPMTDAQRAVLAAYEWHHFDIPTEANATPDGDMSLGYCGRCDASLALYLYASDAWAAATDAGDTMPDGVPWPHAALVWDTRPTADDDVPFSFPCEIPSVDGTALRCRAITKHSVFDWPVDHGDRVLIEMTEASLRRLTNEEFERIGVRFPDQYARLIERYGQSTARQKLREYLADQRRGELVHVTEALHTEILARQRYWKDLEPQIVAAFEGLAERASGGHVTAADLIEALRGVQSAVPHPHAGRARDVPPAAPAPAPGATARRSDSYLAIALPLLRGDISRGGPIAAKLGVTRIPGSVATMSGFAAHAREHVDKSGATLDPGEWAAMRACDSYTLIASGDLHRAADPDDPVDEFLIRVSVEWCGLRFDMYGGDGPPPDPAHRVACDVGAAMFVTFVRVANSAPVMTYMHRHWPCAAGPEAVLEAMRDMQNDPGRIAREAIVIAHVLINQALDVGAGDVKSAGGGTNN